MNLSVLVNFLGEINKLLRVVFVPYTRELCGLVERLESEEELSRGFHPSKIDNVDLRINKRLSKRFLQSSG